MGCILEISKVNHNFILGETSISTLKDININIEEGEFVAIVGKSGSGKSTLLNIIAGLTKPSTGNIRIMGTEITHLNENDMAVFRQRNIGFIFQSYNLIQTMSAIENVQLPLELAGLQRKLRYEKALKILKLLELDHRCQHYPRELSGGEQQRVGIGRAIISKPKIILADEPTGNLDSDTGEQISNCLFEINKNNRTTLILATHDLDLAQKADRIIKIKDGRIYQYEEC